MNSTKHLCKLLGMGKSTFLNVYDHSEEKQVLWILCGREHTAHLLGEHPTGKIHCLTVNRYSGSFHNTQGLEKGDYIIYWPSQDTFDSENEHC